MSVLNDPNVRDIIKIVAAITGPCRVIHVHIITLPFPSVNHLLMPIVIIILGTAIADALVFSLDRDSVRGFLTLAPFARILQGLFITHRACITDAMTANGSRLPCLILTAVIAGIVKLKVKG